MKAVKQKGIVNQAGKIEIQSPELEEGTEVEIIILISSSDAMDETAYLLSTAANRKELLEAIERVEKQEDLVKFTPDKFAEIINDQSSKSPKYSIMELEGLGKEIWQEVDAQEYIEQERESWNG